MNVKIIAIVNNCYGDKHYGRLPLHWMIIIVDNYCNKHNSRCGGRDR